MVAIESRRHYFATVEKQQKHKHSIEEYLKYKSARAGCISIFCYFAPLVPFFTHFGHYFGEFEIYLNENVKSEIKLRITHIENVNLRSTKSQTPGK